jgi:hypothetical protein
MLIKSLFFLLLFGCHGSKDSDTRGVFSARRDGFLGFGDNREYHFLWAGAHPINHNFVCVYEIKIPSIKQSSPPVFPLEIFTASTPLHRHYLSFKQVEREFQQAGQKHDQALGGKTAVHHIGNDVLTISTALYGSAYIASAGAALFPVVGIPLFIGLAAAQLYVGIERGKEINKNAKENNSVAIRDQVEANHNALMGLGEHKELNPEHINFVSNALKNVETDLPECCETNTCDEAELVCAPKLVCDPEYDIAFMLLTGGKQTQVTADRAESCDESASKKLKDLASNPIYKRFTEKQKEVLTREFRINCQMAFSSQSRPNECSLNHCLDCAPCVLCEQEADKEGCRRELKCENCQGSPEKGFISCLEEKARNQCEGFSHRLVPIKSKPIQANPNQSSTAFSSDLCTLCSGEYEEGSENWCRAMFPEKCDRHLSYDDFMKKCGQYGITQDNNAEFEANCLQKHEN